MRERIVVAQVKNGYVVDAEEDGQDVQYAFNHIEHLYEWLQEFFDDQVEPMPPVTKAQEDWKKLTNKIK